MKTNFKEWLGNIFLLLLSVVLVLIFSDLLIRWTLQIPSSYLKKVVMFVPDREPHKRLRPNLDLNATGAYREFTFRIVTNGDGFRSAPERREGRQEPSLVIFGDSQTFGIGVQDEETFARRLEKKLALGVLNTGCPGYNNIEEFLLEREIFNTHKPRSVVFSFFAGNDPYENYQNQNLLNPSAKLEEKRPSGSKPDAVAAFKNFLVKNSALYDILTRLRRFGFINHLLVWGKLAEAQPPLEIEVFRRFPTKRQASFWKVTEAVMLKAYGAAEEKGIGFVVLLIPDRYQVENAYWNQWVQKYNLRAADFDRLAPNQHLKVFCERHQIPYLDATESLRRRELAGERMYWRIDNHLAPSGHETIAQLLYEYFSKTGSSL